MNWRRFIPFLSDVPAPAADDAPTAHVAMELPRPTARMLVESGRAVYVPAPADLPRNAMAQPGAALLNLVAEALDRIADGAKALADALPPPSLSSLVYIDADGLHVPDRDTIAANVRAQYVAMHGQPDDQDQQFLEALADHLHEDAQHVAQVYEALSPAVSR